MHNVPDYTNRFLESSSIAGDIIDAGLPNITGYFAFGEMLSYSANGAFYGIHLAIIKLID